MNQERTKEWLTLNAIECWLHYFPEHKWTNEYKELKDAIQLQIQNINTREVEKEGEAKAAGRPPIKRKAQTPQAKV
jgi:hypothetical protein